MKNFEFKSQICTTKEQSERLLALGLKPETADITLHYERATEDYKLHDIPFSRIMHLWKQLNKHPILGISGDDLYAKDIPAWSLYRLIELAEVSVEISGLWIKISGAYRYEEKDNVYDNLIDAIKELIDNDVFNKDYLEEK